MCQNARLTITDIITDITDIITDITDMRPMANPA